MTDNRDCWLKDNCNKIDCSKDFCLKLFKLDYLYEQALIPLNNRRHRVLKVDASGVDYDEFSNLFEIETNVLDFVNNGGNLYIYSKIPGNGKTSWSLRLIEAFFNKIWANTKLECRALFVSVPKFMLALKNNLNEDDPYAKHILDNVNKADIVIWDDIGTKGLTTFEHEHLLSFIDFRLASGKSNIYSSNLNKQELRNALGDRLYSRITGNSTCIELNGMDKRGISQ